jgi:hypothetical protein
VQSLVACVQRLVARVHWLDARVQRLVVRVQRLVAREQRLAVRVQRLVGRVQRLAVRVQRLVARVQRLVVRVQRDALRVQRRAALLILLSVEGAEQLGWRRLAPFQIAQQKPTTGYAPVNGLKMYYEVHGSGDPVVLLHGSFMTITNNWTEWSKLRRLPPKNCIYACEYKFQMAPR